MCAGMTFWILTDPSTGNQKFPAETNKQKTSAMNFRTCELELKKMKSPQSQAMTDSNRGAGRGGVRSCTISPGNNNIQRDTREKKLPGRLRVSCLFKTETFSCCHFSNYFQGYTIPLFLPPVHVTRLLLEESWVAKLGRHSCEGNLDLERPWSGDALSHLLVFLALRRPPGKHGKYITWKPDSIFVSLPYSVGKI